MRIILLLTLAAASAAHAQDVGEEPFSADPVALVNATPAKKKTGPIETLLAEQRLVYDDNGDVTHRSREVYRILDQAGASSRARVYTAYAPWRDDRPKVRARVITRDGAVHELDAATLTEAQEGEVEDEVFSDRHVLTGPLPAVAVGAVVEIVIETRTHRAPFEHGTLDRIYLNGDGTYALRVVVQAAPSIKVHAVVHGTKLAAPAPKTLGAYRVTTWQMPEATQPVWRPFLPPDVPRWPYLVVSTGRSWREVAAGYRDLVEERIASADVDALAHTIAGDVHNRDMVLQRLLAAVQQRVRYTGLEFGSAAIVPRPPAETLRNNFGDCKDLAVLLVALARKAGIPGRLALLRVGDDEEIDADAPGLDLFNHVVAYFPGKPAYFVDVTAPYLTLGDIPIGDQGRLALVLDDSFALTPVPAAPSAANTFARERTIRLAAEGGASIVEDTTATGSRAYDLRERYVDVPDDKLLERIAGYTGSAFQVKSAKQVTRSSFADATQSPKLHIEVDNSPRGWTNQISAQLFIDPTVVVAPLPFSLRSERSTTAVDNVADADADPDEQGASARRKAPRTEDWLIAEPFIAVLKLHVFPPAGFVPDALPAPIDRKVGSARMSSTALLRADGGVDLELRFDSGARRLSAAEGEALRSAVVAFQTDAPHALTFEHAGWKLLGQGKLTEGFAEYRRAVLAAPGDALVRERFSGALLEKGFGDAARAVAKDAVRVDPKRWQAQQQLAWALAHDVVGRRFGRGFDRDGAVAAYRQAVALDPGHDKDLRTAFAATLEYNNDGLRYGPGALLSEAAAIESALVKDFPDDAGLGELLSANLYWSGNIKGAYDAALKAPRSPARDAMLLASLVCLQGVAAGVTEAPHLAPEHPARIALLTPAAALLLAERRYPEGLALFELAHSLGAPLDPSQTKMLELGKKLGRWDQPRAPSPSAAVLDAIGRLVTADDPDAAVAPLLATRVTKALAAGAARTGAKGKNARAKAAVPATPALPQSFQNAIREFRTVRNNGTQRDFMADVVVTTLTTHEEGSDSDGWRVTVTSDFAPGSPAEPWYVVKERGGYRVVAAGDVYAELGAQVLAFLADNKTAAAKRWLGWIDASLKIKDDDDLAHGRLLHEILKSDKPSSAELRAAAASAMVYSAEPQDVSLLQPLVTKKPSPVTHLWVLADLELAEAHARNGNIDEAKRILDALLVDLPSSKGLRYARLFLFDRSDRRDLAHDEAIAFLHDVDDMSPTALVLLARDAMKAGLPDDALRLYQKLLDAGTENHSAENAIAWQAQFGDKPLAPAVTLAEQLNRQTNYGEYAFLNTLASLYASSGRVVDAQGAFTKSLDATTTGDLHAADWFVLGRIEEDVGLLEAARAAYLKVTPSPTSSSVDDTHLLAEKRLSLLPPERATVAP